MKEFRQEKKPETKNISEENFSHLKKFSLFAPAFFTHKALSNSTASARDLNVV